jgi:peptide/nickel transport system substrate-binding protein
MIWSAGDRAPRPSDRSLGDANTQGRSRRQGRRSKWLLAAASAWCVVGALMLSACGGDDAADDEGAEAEETLIWAKSWDIESIDPAHAHEVTGEIVISALYDQLLTFSGADSPSPEPLVAESYEVSDDQRTFTFQLRDDVTFSDGTPLTSEDVVFSFMRLKNVEGTPSYRAEPIESVEADGPHRVIIRTTEPTPSLPAVLAGGSFSILNSEVVRANGGDAGPDAAENDNAQAFLDRESAGSGPFVLRTYERRSQVVLDANDEFWGEKPSYRGLILKAAIPENQVLEVRRGSSHLAVDLAPTHVEDVPEGEAQVLRYPSTTFFFLALNSDPGVSEAAANPDFREAVRYGIDYEDLVNLAGEGAVQIPGLIPNTIAGHLPEEAASQRDVERARAALERSGIEDPTIHLEYPSDFTLAGLSFGTIAQRIQNHLRDVGIRVELAPGPLATTLDNWRAGREEMGLWTTTPPFPAAHTYLSFCPGGSHGLRMNWQEGANPQIEQACERAAAVPLDDTDALEDAFGEVQRMLVDGGPHIPLFQPAQVVVAADWVTNIQPSPTSFVQVRELGR